MRPLSVSVVRVPCMDEKRAIEIAKSADQVAVRGAELFLEAARRAIDERGRFTVALSGGSSPAPLFRTIAEQASTSGIDWGAVHVFWVDERCVPPDHPDSNFRMARELLLSRLPAPGAVIHRIAGELPPTESAIRYEEDLSLAFGGDQLPVFDMLFLGVGRDGHTASLFPGMADKGDQGRKAVAMYAENLDSHRVTLTLPVINNARRVVFMVTGAGKADIVAEILEGKNAGRYPAGRVAPLRGSLTWLLDADAGENLRQFHRKTQGIMETMSMWERYKEHLTWHPEIGMLLDISGMNFPAGFFETWEPFLVKVFRQMAELEDGAVANPDEGRMVGHYWLRTPYLAPTREIQEQIETTITGIRDFAAQVHSGEVAPAKGGRFSRFLLIGIGGSALGPQFLADALGNSGDPLTPHFFDNTDPDGMDRVLAGIGDGLAETLTLVISKSGGTKETRNGMLEAAAAYQRAGLDFAAHAVAVTGAGSGLDRLALEGKWLARFPMWDWVGGRTSVMSAVGLLPAALQGIDIDALLEGARLCDALTRMPNSRHNPAIRLALMWRHATGGTGEKDMVILPYRDRLLLFSRYLQQLVMESLGKEKDLSGAVVHQGIAVYGNKGATDQHAFVQQLRDGVNNFFVTFIETLRDREVSSPAVEPGVTSGDYLSGFLQGTRKALAEKGRESLTITLEAFDARSVGALIALYERAVGYYAFLVGINAYHQPGVEAGKKAAGEVLRLQGEILAHLRQQAGKSMTAEEIAAAIGASHAEESVFRILLHAAANVDHGVLMKKKKPFTSSRFGSV